MRRQVPELAEGPDDFVRRRRFGTVEKQNVFLGAQGAEVVAGAPGRPPPSRPAFSLGLEQKHDQRGGPPRGDFDCFSSQARAASGSARPHRSAMMR